LNALDEKRLIFAVSTGRSGTGYLARVLRCVPGVAAYHEPEPRFSHVMRAALRTPAVARTFWVEAKLPRIAGVASAIYAETSHLFGKGFVEPLLDLGIQPDLIVLARDHRPVALSLYRLHMIPARTPQGRRYLLQPDDPGVLSLRGWEGLHDYQLCYWYCLEMARRAEHYAAVFEKQGGAVARLSLADLVRPDGWMGLIETLRLPRPGLWPRARYELIRRRRVNGKVRADPPPTPAHLHDMEQEVHDLTFAVSTSRHAGAVGP
jgi:hypothetical protein